MKDFFTSDNHFCHDNIIRLCGRPYTSISQMHEDMISRWNATVSTTDRVWVVGDFSFKGHVAEVETILSRLNGEKHLILGNHDSREVQGWASVSQYRELKINSKKVVLFHYPIEEWNGFHRGTYHIHGHVHGNHPEKPEKLIMDAGADYWNFTPVSWDEVEVYMEAKTPTYTNNHRVRNDKAE